MKKLKKMKKDIDKGLPSMGELIDDTSKDLSIKSTNFINAVTNGIDKFFSLD